jgi:SPP1 family predicted phage head-tail adaptor
MTQIGEFNRRITFQSSTKTSDSMGGFTETWADVVTVWTKMTTHRSDESVQAMATTGIRVHNFRIHYRPDVVGSWRVQYGTRYMNIIGLTEVCEGLGGRYLDVTCKEATA